MSASKIAEREPQHPTSGDFLRDIVFGANDGVVTAIGFLVGIVGTVSDQGVVVVAGALTVIAGAASMALGNYLGVKSQKEHYDAMEAVENWEIDNKPEIEKREVREIYTDMGFDKEAVEILTKKVTSDRKLWIKVMMRDELGFSEKENDNPVIAGGVMGITYLIGGLPPLLPFIFFKPLSRALIISVIVSVFVMALIGTFRWWLNKGGLGKKVVETIVIGLLAAGIGFLAGEVLRYVGISDIAV